MKNNVWLLLGPELGKKEEFLRELKRKFWENSAKQGSPDSEKSEAEFICGFDSVGHIADYIRTPSLFESQHFITILQLEALSAVDAKKLAEALSASETSTMIVLVSDEVKVKTSFDTVAKAQKRVFWKLSEEEYFDYLIHKSRENGLPLTTEALEMMLIMVGDNLAELDFFLQQIHQFCKQKNLQRVGMEEIENWFTHYKRETVFSLFLEISRKNYAAAFDDIKLLLDSGETAIRIMAGLIYQCNTALQILRQYTTGVSFYNACTMFNVRSRTAQEQYSRFLAGMDVARMEEMLQLCVDTDATLRSSTAQFPADIYLSLFLYNLYRLHIGGWRNSVPF